MQIKSSTTYKDSGVDIKKADQFISQIKPLAKATYRPEVLAGLGGFGALFHIDFQKYKDPVIVSSTDGVGTKLKIAFMANRHDTIGLDLVAMSANDLATFGKALANGWPLGTIVGSAQLMRHAEVVSGHARYCNG